MGINSYVTMTGLVYEHGLLSNNNCLIANTQIYLWLSQRSVVLAGASTQPLK